MIENGDEWNFAARYDDAGIANSLNLRVVHTASSRELVFEYQADGASGWTELARLNLASGSFSTEYTTHSNGEYESVNVFTPGLIGSTERMQLDVEVEAGQVTQSGDMEISRIAIGWDSDGDGLDDSVETNTGVYVSPSNTGTDPNQSDTSGDGFTDGEALAAGVDPNESYLGLFAIVLDDPERFTADVQDLRIGAEIAAVTAGEATLQIVLEESEDLTTWSHRQTVDLAVTLEVDETSKFLRYSMKGASPLAGSD